MPTAIRRPKCSSACPPFRPCPRTGRASAGWRAAWASSCREPFDESNQANLSRALDGLATFGDSLGAAGPQIGQLVGEASTAVQRLAGLADRLDALLANLDGAIGSGQDEINATLQDLRRASESFTAAMARLDATLAATRKPLATFASQGLPQITGLATEATDAVRQLRQLLRRLETEGGGFLLQGTQIPEYTPRSR